MITVTYPENVKDGVVRPKLVFFACKHKELSPFVLRHKQEHIKCLSAFFDVTVIDEDSDYQQICDKYRPDLTMLESALYFSSCVKPKVRNVRAYPQIPKLGLLHADAFGEGRAGFLSDADYWGIETFFTIATAMAEYTPEISDHLFVWPNFVDADLYHDYGQPKNIPVLFTGNTNALYPWRQKIIRRVSKSYPSLICPHPGYGQSQAAAQFTNGEFYARMLNASWFVPACGTVANELVRKHLEAPACKACLIAERSPVLEGAGFKDMQNCVFADEENVLDKVEYLFRNPDVLDSIIREGYQLVHTRHTLSHRDQILQWFKLHKILRSSERILQTSPFEPLRIVDKSLGPNNSHIISNGVHRELLREGDQRLWAGKYSEAESLYFRCLNYYRYMPEPQLRLGLCNLYKGNAKQAVSWILKPVQFTLTQYNAADPDPVEWAYLIISLFCAGKARNAARRAKEFSWLRHPELDRARWMTEVLTNGESSKALVFERAQVYRRSVHQLPTRSLKQWIKEICVMLRACGQSNLAETLARRVDDEPEPFRVGRQFGKNHANRHVDELERDLSARRPFLFGSKNAVSYFRRRQFYDELRFMLKGLLRQGLHAVEAKYGYFLPYRSSKNKKDAFFGAIRELISRDDIKAVLIIGAALRAGTTQAVLDGAEEHNKKPSLFCISVSKGPFARLQKVAAKLSGLRWYQLSSWSRREELKDAVKSIALENHVEFFDVVIIDGSELSAPMDLTYVLDKALPGAKFVLLDDINGIRDRKNYERLTQSSSYVVVDQDPGLRNGYAIFENMMSTVSVSYREHHLLSPDIQISPHRTEASAS